MKQFNLKIVLVCIFCSNIIFLTTSRLSAANEESVYKIHNVLEGIGSIQKYHARLKVKIYAPSTKGSDPEHTVDSESEIYGESGRRMKITTNLEMHELGSVTEWTQIFDMTYLWIQTKVKNIDTNELLKTKIKKIHIPSTSSDIINKPFDTIYWINGIGIFNYKDLPGTFYQILEDYNFDMGRKSESSNHIVFHGLRKSDEKIQKMKIDDESLKEYLDLSTRFSSILVSKDTGLIEEYLIGESEKKPVIHTEISYYSVNENIPNHIFIYNPPEGVKVEDITSSILKMNKN